MVVDGVVNFRSVDVSNAAGLAIARLGCGVLAACGVVVFVRFVKPADAKLNADCFQSCWR